MLQGMGCFEPKPGRVILPDVCCGISLVAGRAYVTGPMTRAAHGYADQSHFARDTRAFTGRTPGSLLPHVGNLQEVVCGEL